MLFLPKEIISVKIIKCNNLQLIIPIFDNPKSVSFMWPVDVINKLEKRDKHHRNNYNW